MESTQFCGAACHTVMDPEFTTYKRSPHARVKCVECHIGEGANWFVKSKLSGSWQLVSVSLRPLPAPDPGPRPQPPPRARDLRAVPLAEQVRGRPVQGQHPLLGGRGEHRDEDGARREGRGPAGRAQPGHPLARGPRPRACATARTRSGRRSTRSRRRRRTARRSASSGPAASSPEAAKATEWRTMDCVDCHNRPVPHLPRPRARARRRAPRPEDRPLAALRPARGAEGPPGRVPEPRGGPRRASRRRSPRSTRSPTRRSPPRRRRPSPRRARPSATSGAGTCSRR